jgi:hypothetical protein
MIDLVYEAGHVYGLNIGFLNLHHTFIDIFGHASF